MRFVAALPLKRNQIASPSIVSAKTKLYRGSTMHFILIILYLLPSPRSELTRVPSPSTSPSSTPAGAPADSIPRESFQP